MKTVRFEQQDAVGSIILVNPPEQELGRRFADDLANAVHEASDSDIKVLVVRTEGPNFGTGGNVPEWPGKSASWFRTFIAEVNQSYAAIEALRVPTVASVRGRTISGHYELVLRCDLIVAAEDATFTWVEATTGMAPLAGGVQRLAERIGRGRAAAHVMLGETITGVEAGRIGLAARVVPESALDHEVRAIAQQLTGHSRQANAAIKSLLKAWAGSGTPGADAIALDLTMDLFETDEAQENFRRIKQAAESAKASTAANG
ncbi:enoyl-CoA hydratase/isomerase family protein [Fodinicola feengrottensis]|uniref:Enoyl-CoA hydratase/isomerase family protein n=1 Tax=Fodinicola feengrottensis TaxID=435914 RepID=A0ABP4UD19_9ACTN